MSQIILKSPDEKSIEALVVAALEAEKKEILTGILKTKEKLSLFEKRFNLSTADFLANVYHEIPLPISQQLFARKSYLSNGRNL